MQTAIHNSKHTHWHHVYRKRRRHALGINSRWMALGQILSVAGAAAAGLHLDHNKSSLALITGVFVIMPGIFDLTGSLGAALSAKVNHHLKESVAKTGVVLTRAILFALMIALLAGTLVSAIGGSLAWALFDASFWTIFQLSIGAILLAAAIGFPLVGLATVALRKVNINPDDVMGPIETTFFDMVAVLSLVIVASWLV